MLSQARFFEDDSRKVAVAKYDPLRKHLRRRNAPEIVMSFDEVELVIGDMLPKSASLPAWWGNERTPETRHVQCLAWTDAGYVATLMPCGAKVHFTRKRRS